MRRLATAAATTAAALALTGCGADGSGGSGSGSGISVESAYMPQPVSGSMAAGFLTLVNDSGTEDELTSVTSDAAGEVTVHRTAGGAMREADALPVPAHGRLVFESGGNHLMFENLKRKPEQGQTVAVVLHFATSDPVVVRMPVKPATYTPDTGH